VSHVLVCPGFACKLTKLGNFKHISKLLPLWLSQRCSQWCFTDAAEMEFTRENRSGLGPGGICSIGSYKEILLFVKATNPA